MFKLKEKKAGAPYIVLLVILASAVVAFSLYIFLTENGAQKQSLFNVDSVQSVYIEEELFISALNNLFYQVANNGGDNSPEEFRKRVIEEYLKLVQNNNGGLFEKYLIESRKVFHNQEGKEMKISNIPKEGLDFLQVTLKSFKFYTYSPDKEIYIEDVRDIEFEIYLKTPES